MKPDLGFLDISKDYVPRTFCTKRSAIFASLLDFQKIKGVIKLMSWLSPCHWIFPSGLQLHSKILRCWRWQCCCPITWRICPESRIKAVNALMSCMTAWPSQSPFQKVHILTYLHDPLGCQLEKNQKKKCSFWFHDRMQCTTICLVILSCHLDPTSSNHWKWHKLASGHQGWASKKCFNKN